MSTVYINLGEVGNKVKVYKGIRFKGVSLDFYDIDDGVIEPVYHIVMSVKQAEAVLTGLQIELKDH